METFNISDNTTMTGYIKETNAKLKITSVPRSDRTIEFPAFLTDFSQTFDAKWNTEEVFGRMDPIATYQGTKRTMSLGFDLPAGNVGEADRNLLGCSELIKMVYPIYNQFDIPNSGDDSGNNKKKTNPILSKPPLVRIKFANLISGNDANGLLGWISGLSWKPNLEMGMFAKGKNLFPKVIALSFSFNILHEVTLSQEKVDFFGFRIDK